MSASLDRAKAADAREAWSWEQWLDSRQAYTDGDGKTHGWKTGRAMLAHFDRSFARTEPKKATLSNSKPNPKTHSDAIAVPTRNGGFAMEPLADSDESELYDLRKTPKWKAATRARDTYSRLCKRETGNCGDPQKVFADRREKDELKDQSHRIAAILESQGIDAYRNDEHGVYIYHPHSGCVLQVPKFRRICFLPSVAASLRAPIVKALESYLECNPFARMWTFTHGTRTELPQLRSELKRFHRRLSRFSSWLRRKWRVEMVFRATELGNPETHCDGTDDASAGDFELPADEDGKRNGPPSFHIHAHCLVQLLDGPMAKEDWSRMLEEVWAKWGSNWDDGKSVQTAKELCKYVSKPGSVLKLEPHEIAELYHALRRLKMVAPLGELRAEIKARKERKLTLVRTPTPDGVVLEEVDDWNAHGEKKSALELALDRLPKKVDEAGPKILARLVPGYAPEMIVKEPRVVVVAKEWDEAAVRRHPLVKMLIVDTWQEWRAGQELAASIIRVHTGTPTVPRQANLGFWHEVEERVRPAGEPIFERFEDLEAVK